MGDLLSFRQFRNETTGHKKCRGEVSWYQVCEYLPSSQHGRAVFTRNVSMLLICPRHSLLPSPARRHPGNKRTLVNKIRHSFVKSTYSNILRIMKSTSLFIWKIFRNQQHEFLLKHVHYIKSSQTSKLSGAIFAWQRQKSGEGRRS